MTTSGQIKCPKCGGVIGGSVDRCECPLSARHIRFAGPFVIPDRRKYAPYSDPDRGLFIVGMVCVVLSIIGAIAVFVIVFAP